MIAGSAALDLVKHLNAPGLATLLTVTVKAPATSHEVRVSRIEAWLQRGGRSPNEQAMKIRLRELLGP